MASVASPTSPSGTGRLGLDADLFQSAQGRLTRDDVFADLRRGADGSEASATPGSPEEMQKQDPLATEIWRFFSKTKQQLPNMERMENLTWRMMHVKLKTVQPPKCVFMFSFFVLFFGLFSRKDNGHTKRSIS